jgi:hypothetical protein
MYTQVLRQVVLQMGGVDVDIAEVVVELLECLEGDEGCLEGDKGDEGEEGQGVNMDLRAEFDMMIKEVVEKADSNDDAIRHAILLSGLQSPILEVYRAKCFATGADPRNALMILKHITDTWLAIAGALGGLRKAPLEELDAVWFECVSGSLWGSCMPAVEIEAFAGVFDGYRAEKDSRPLFSRTRSYLNEEGARDDRKSA